MSLRLAERVDQCRDILAEGLQSVVRDPCWPGRIAEASHIRCDGPVSRASQGGDEMTVLVRQLRKAMKEDDQGTLAICQVMESDAVRIDELRPHHEGFRPPA